MRRSHTRSRNRGFSRGFTLMEVILVLAILGVIAAMVVPNLVGRQQQANIDATKLSIRGLEQALQLFTVDNDGGYPTSQDGLQALLEPPSNMQKWKGPYLTASNTLPLDPWGNPFQYAFPGSHQPGNTKPDIWSWGPDRQDGTEDDITNWSTVP